MYIASGMNRKTTVDFYIICTIIVITYVMTHVHDDCYREDFMDTSKRIYMMVLSALLIAVGILIPIISPIKVMIEPMSFTLASHVAIMVAIFVSPFAAVATAAGTTLGFLLYGFPLPVVLRALTHIVWAFAGAYYLKKHPETMNSMWKTMLFMFVIACIHALGEIIVSIPFYTNTSGNSFLYMVFGLVGIGTIIHSCVDFVISMAVWKCLVKNKRVASISNVTCISWKVEQQEHISLER